MVGVERAQPHAQRRHLKITLKPRAERGVLVTAIIDRLQQAVAAHPGHDASTSSRCRTCRSARAPAARSTSTRWSAATPTRSPSGRPSSPRSCAVARAARGRISRPRTAACARCVKVDRETAGPPRRLHAGHQRRAQRRLRPAPDLDHLRPGQPVPRGAGGACRSTRAIPRALPPAVRPLHATAPRCR